MPQQLRTELGDIGAKFIINVTDLLQLSIYSPPCIGSPHWNEHEPVGGEYWPVMFAR